MQQKLIAFSDIVRADPAVATATGFTGGGHLDHRADEGLLGAGAERVVTNWDEAQRLFEAL